MTATTLREDARDRACARLAQAAREHADAYPGDGTGRQPVHTVYGGAHLFRADTPRKLGALARASFDEHAPDAATLARAVGMAVDLAERVHPRVADKLRREPIEDYRIDFEDGYGVRPHAEEDEHAVAAAEQLAAAMQTEGALPPRLGIRIKSLSGDAAPRALRTLDVFLTSLVRRTGGALPGGFVITLPKITSRVAVETLASVLGELEASLGLANGAIGVELMVEHPQTLVARDGSLVLGSLVRAAGGRCVAAHFGTYDYTASLGVSASDQGMQHPACDGARHLMQLTLAGTGVWLSDGATTVMPVAPHRASAGAPLTDAQQAENRAVVHRAWKLAYHDIRRSLSLGFYQGWDLHPAQIPVRYAATHAFFLSSLDASAARLRAFVQKAAQATRAGDVFDDAATGQGLLNFFLRAIAAGAIDEQTACERTGLTRAQMASRSFGALVALA